MKLFNQIDLTELVCELMGIDVHQFKYLTVQRGSRPVKAAIRLGADIKTAQLLASLKLATTTEEINTVYKDGNVLSCMSGTVPGAFFERNKIGVIYSDNFRCLIGLENRVINPRGYGFNATPVYNYLLEKLNTGCLVEKTKLQFMDRRVKIVNVKVTDVYENKFDLSSIWGGNKQVYKNDFRGKSSTISIDVIEKLLRLKAISHQHGSKAYLEALAKYPLEEGIHKYQVYGNFFSMVQLSPHDARKADKITNREIGKEVVYEVKGDVLVKRTFDTYLKGVEKVIMTEVTSTGGYLITCAGDAPWIDFTHDGIIDVADINIINETEDLVEDYYLNKFGCENRRGSRYSKPVKRFAKAA